MTRVKICGITRLEDAELAASLGAWALGFILWPGSSARSSPAVAAGIARRVRRQAELVGVFVNPTLDEVAHAAEAIGLTHVQLHGDEGPSFCRPRSARRTGAKVIKAARVAGGADICRRSSASTPTSTCSTPPSRAMRGGTGRTWDWSLAAQRRSKVPLILSGGLNARERRRRRSPPCARARSTSPPASRPRPGIKDPAKVEAFLAVAAPARARPSRERRRRSSTASAPTAASTCPRR